MVAQIISRQIQYEQSSKLPSSDQSEPTQKKRSGRVGRSLRYVTNTLACPARRSRAMDAEHLVAEFKSHQITWSAEQSK